MSAAMPVPTDIETEAEVFVLTAEAARILEISPDTVRIWERTGRLHALKTSRGVRLFYKCDVERLARERQNRTG